jgi:hypothetical protein
MRKSLLPRSDQRLIRITVGSDYRDRTVFIDFICSKSL